MSCKYCSHSDYRARGFCSVECRRFFEYEEEIAEFKALIGYCITDMYKPSGRISKPTAIKLIKYMSDNDLLKH